MLDFPKAAEIAQAEAWHALRLAAEALPRELFPLGHPLDMKNAANKLRQLHLAARLGFSVPETVVSNDPVVLHAFLARHERVAVKPLHASIAYAESAREDTGRWIACRSFEASVLLDRLASGRRSQLLLQRAIPKKFDWRVTVLPHRTIACEIDTGSLPPGEPDWRLQSMSLPHRLIDLPDLFEGLLRSFLADIGLPVGYFDFAVDTDGTPWFLEMNTNAQWLWIEHLTGFPISREVAEALAARNL